MVDGKKSSKGKIECDTKKVMEVSEKIVKQMHKLNDVERVFVLHMLNCSTTIYYTKIMTGE